MRRLNFIGTRGFSFVMACHARGSEVDCGDDFPLGTRQFPLGTRQSESTPDPFFLRIGQRAGVAAALAAKQSVAVQDLPYPQLHKRFEAQGQVLALPNVPKPVKAH